MSAVEKAYCVHCNNASIVRDGCTAVCDLGVKVGKQENSDSAVVPSLYSVQ